MASTKMKALLEIARIVAGIAAGYLVYWKWDEVRTGDPEYYAILAGIIVSVMFIVLLKKLNKGEG
ncbi:MAG: hypothetical protein ABIH83_01300 [Candidatus Micrarchaeota archaeon]